jgi:Spy/CpxP family protein refolding chaperone
MYAFNRSGFLGVSIIIVLGAAQAGAEPDHDRRSAHGPMARFERHAEEIGLTEAQRKEMQGLVDEESSQREELHAKTRVARDELHAMMASESPDETAVLAKVASLGDLKTTSQIARTRLSLALRNVLTPAQRKQIASLGDRAHGGHHGKPKYRHKDGHHDGQSCSHHDGPDGEQGSDDDISSRRSQ